MIESLISGGPIMIPIGLCSIISVAALLERVWALRRSRVIPAAVVRRVLDHARAGRFDEAHAIALASETTVGRILEVALDMRGRARGAIKERLEEVGRREAFELERYLPVLSTIGSIGTLLGLLGTVSGMILTFAATRDAHGDTSIEQVAGGIAQALITTFAGLVVAIPAVVAHRYLLAKVDSLLIDLEEASLLLLDVVSKEAIEAQK